MVLKPEVRNEHIAAYRKGLLTHIPEHLLHKVKERVEAMDKAAGGAKPSTGTLVYEPPAPAEKKEQKGK